VGWLDARFWTYGCFPHDELRIAGEELKEGLRPVGCGKGRKPKPSEGGQVVREVGRRPMSGEGKGNHPEREQGYI